MSAAKRRQRRSRKSPSVAVPPGNWCEIFSVPACAQAAPAIGRAPAAATLPIHSRLVIAIGRLLSGSLSMAFCEPGNGLAIGSLAKAGASPRRAMAPRGARPRLGRPRRTAPQQEPRMQNAIAFCDNDVVVVAWSYGHKVEGCMG